MKHKVIIPTVAIAFAIAHGTAAIAADNNFEEWLETAQLGEFQPQDEDWAAIIAKAKAEGELTIYSSMSAVNTVAEDFQKLYPEIKVNAFDLGSEKTIEKTVREHRAALYNVDIVNTGGAAQMIHELLPNQDIVNYVPRYLEALIPVDLREPVLTNIVEAVVPFYSTDAYPDGPPITNLWELTEPEWTKRVGMKSPLGSLSTLGMITNLVEHSDEFATAYEAHAGKPLVLSDGIENATFEFFHRLIENDLVIYSSGSKLAAASGAIGQENPPISLSSMHYVNKNASDGYANAILYDVEPSGLYAYSTYTSIAGLAPHPNAAKLYVAFQMGSQNITPDTEFSKPFREGEALDLLHGMAAFYKVGTFSPRDDITPPMGAEKWATSTKFWGTPEHQRDNVALIADFWIYETGK